MARRFGQDDMTRGFLPQFHESRFEEPVHRKKPARIFVCSTADLFGDWIPHPVIRRIRNIVKTCPQHTFQFLTKNPYRYREFKPWPQNAWLGVTVTTDDKLYYADPAMTFARRSATEIQFASVEPMLGRIDLKGPDHWAPDWLIIGAQTGPGAKLPEVHWVRRLTDQAVERGIPVFHKRSLLALSPKFNRRELPLMKGQTDDETKTRTFR
jgi:protein gp37